MHSKTRPPQESCRQIRRRPKRKSSNLRKDHLQVFTLALNPSRNLVPESKPRGRGQFQSNFSASFFRCWVYARDSQNAQRATVCSRFIFYTIDLAAAQGEHLESYLIWQQFGWVGVSLPLRNRTAFNLQEPLHSDSYVLWFLAAPDDCAELVHGRTREIVSSTLASAQVEAACKNRSFSAFFPATTRRRLS
jgi:hypothetical protein